MRSVGPKFTTGYEDAAATFRMRLWDDTDAPLKQADFSTIKARVYDKVDLTTLVWSDLAVTIASAVFNAYQTWGQDDIGYNFSHTIPQAAFASGGKIYLIDYEWTLTDGNIGAQTIEHSTLERVPS